MTLKHPLYVAVIRSGSYKKRYLDSLLGFGENIGSRACNIRLSSGTNRPYYVHKTFSSMLRVYVDDMILTRDNLDETTRMKTHLSFEFEIKNPMDPNINLEKVIDPVDNTRYRKLVGKLIYLSHTCPDIAFAINMVIRFMHTLYEEYLDVMYRTTGKGLFSKKNEHRGIEVYIDADWAIFVIDKRYTSLYYTYG
ncbi:uncharacterized protein LOC111397867 [Olea europaea var. sylvestris]|uniref:uncharacterized protein LOC111397867 n=1 Tax=Olea europaea var. sylvestris TaxID=158386 RepID=UPI000C1D25E5|nr:uncharacterized protein LOC111397867 [Olea europaea var. sylvestris]